MKEDARSGGRGRDGRHGVAWCAGSVVERSLGIEKSRDEWKGLGEKRRKNTSNKSTLNLSNSQLTCLE